MLQDKGAIYVDRLLARCQGNLSLVNNILSLAVKSFRTDQQQLQQAAEQGHWHHVGQLTHRIQGAAHYGEMPRLKQACIELVSAIGSAAARPPQAIFQAVLEEIDQVAHAYEAQLAASA